MTGPFAPPALIKETGSAILYGAGNIGRLVHRVLTTNGIRVICFLDQAVGDGEIAGLPIYPPDSDRVDPIVRRDVPLIVTIFNRDVDIVDLAQMLRTLGYCHIVSFVDVHSLFPAQLGNHFWLTTRDESLSQRAPVQTARTKWADERSRAIFDALLTLRSGGYYSDRLRPTRGEIQYFPNDVPGWPGRRPIRFVDCGAYDGDTLAQFRATKISLSASVHFEPDLYNFEKLVSTESIDKSGDSRSIFLPCAVGNRSQLVRFQSGFGEGSSVASEGTDFVMAVALDDVLARWEPTLIKFDVEGSELDALQGARKLIAGAAPTLAVCGYHRPDHLWRIPSLIEELAGNRSYQFYVRVHGFNGFDTVIYACSGTN